MLLFTFIIEGNQAKIIKETQLESSNTLKLAPANAKPILEALSKGLVPYINLKTKEITIKGQDDAFGGYPVGSKKSDLALALKDNINSRMDDFSSIDMVIYMESMLELSDAGYVITDKNREEKYLEILEADDEDLLELLEAYLILKDSIASIKNHKKTYNSISDKIKTLDEKDPQFVELYNKYIS